MRLAKTVNINTTQGGYSLSIGEHITAWDKKAPIIDRIEVYFDEYHDHSESTINIMAKEKIVRTLWNCPVDVVYLLEED